MPKAFHAKIQEFDKQKDSDTKYYVFAFANSTTVYDDYFSNRSEALATASRLYQRLKHHADVGVGVEAIYPHASARDLIYDNGKRLT